MRPTPRLPESAVAVLATPWLLLVAALSGCGTNTTGEQPAADAAGTPVDATGAPSADATGADAVGARGAEASLRDSSSLDGAAPAEAGAPETGTNDGGALVDQCGHPFTPPPLPMSASGPEIGGAAYAPIVHKDSPNAPFLEEPQLFSYSPRFDPNFVTFDGNNHPYIHTFRRSANSSCPVGWFDQSLLQTVDSTQMWTTIDLTAWARATLPPVGAACWNGCERGGVNLDNRIVFDHDGAAYVFISATESNVPYGILMYSPDGGATWSGYWLKNSIQSVTGNGPDEGWQATLEFQDGHNPLSGPPVILIEEFFDTWGTPQTPSANGSHLYFQLPVKSGKGLTFPPPVRVTTSPNSMDSPEQSGASNKVVHTSSNRIHIVYHATTAPLGVTCAATPTYARTYDLNSSTFTSPTPTYIGCAGAAGTGGTLDGHDSPGLTLDSHNYLHVVLGAHHQSLQYTKSTNPDDTTSWTALTPIGEAPPDGYTYVSLICDQNDTLHVVARYEGIGYYFRVAYLRRKTTETDPRWESFPVSPDDPTVTQGTTLHHQHLVVPFHAYYALYHHKLNIDRKGNLYLNYATADTQLTDQQGVDYCARFPDDFFVSGPTSYPSCKNGALLKDCSACRSQVLVPYQSMGVTPVGAPCSFCSSNAGCTPAYCDHSATAQPHSPSMLVSTDGGDTWHLATTQDFVAGL